ncbi:MAG: YggT family protein [Acidovorax defluvii]
MLFQILSFLLDVASGLLTGACLLRLYMQLQRVSFANPVGRLVFALSDWLVLPLRKLVPSAGRWDLSVSGLMGLLIVYAVLSWVQTRSPISDVITRLCEPLLRPVRRVLPLLGGVDLSPLVVLVLLQVVMIVLGHLQASVMM